jgi:hypothetical protein
MVVIGGFSYAGSTNSYVQSVEMYGPVLTVAPSSGAKGTTVTVSGSNFAATASVTISFRGTAIVTGTTDSVGVFSPATFSVPNVGSGSYEVRAVDNQSQYPVHKTFVVP